MKAITVRNLVLGDGVPKICVPLVGKNDEEIRSQAEAAASEKPDLLEWRADYFEGFRDPGQNTRILQSIRAAAPDLPILFTLRTQEEGGLAEPETYGEVIRAACEDREVDLIDMEVLRDEQTAGDLVAEAFRAGKATIASAHFFDRTPPAEEMVEILDRLEMTGADLLKLAVMPQDMDDVTALMRVTTNYGRTCRCPIITMAMGELGAVTRVTGRLTGSAMTFGSVGEASAPGQMPVRELKEQLRMI